MTDQSAEAQVRAYWKPESVKTGAAALHLSDYCSGIIVGSFECQNWDTALVFTLGHQRKVAELEEEIKLVEYCRDTYYWCCEEPDTIARILARLQAALSELRRGTRGAA
jgi:hypothetical protein